MEKLANEIFNILKGANLQVVLYTDAGQKTINPEEATRFYTIDDDMMVTLRIDDSKSEVVIQVGSDFDLQANRPLLKSLKSAAHKAMGEFTLRRFNKNITPKDFAHQSVTESFGKAHGSIKTSYIAMPESRLIIKHTKGVNEEVKGARSRNIHSLFIENAAGERVQFPHRYLAGAKAMLRHVNGGGTFEDAKGSAILAMCEEISHLSAFTTHVKTNNLVNEANQDVLETVKEKLGSLKETIRSLQTVSGYNAFNAPELVENDNLGVDIVNKFMHNTFENAGMDSVLSTVARVVSEREEQGKMSKNALADIYSMIQNGTDFQITIDPNDAEHPDNEDPIKYSGGEGPTAKLSSFLSFLAKNSKNDEAFNVLSRLSSDVHNLDNKAKQTVAKVVMYLVQKAEEKPMAQPKAESISESVIADLRRTIA